VAEAKESSRVSVGGRAEAAAGGAAAVDVFAALARIESQSCSVEIGRAAAAAVAGLGAALGDGRVAPALRAPLVRGLLGLLHVRCVPGRHGSHFQECPSWVVRSDARDVPAACTGLARHGITRQSVSCQDCARQAQSYGVPIQVTYNAADLSRNPARRARFSMLWGPVSGALGAALGAAPGAAWLLVLRALADTQAAFLAGRGGGEAGPPCQLFFAKRT